MKNIKLLAFLAVFGAWMTAPVLAEGDDAATEEASVEAALAPEGDEAKAEDEAAPAEAEEAAKPEGEEAVEPESEEVKAEEPKKDEEAKADEAAKPSTDDVVKTYQKAIGEAYDAVKKGLTEEGVTDKKERKKLINMAAQEHKKKKGKSEKSQYASIEAYKQAIKEAYDTARKDLMAGGMSKADAKKALNEAEDAQKKKKGKGKKGKKKQAAEPAAV